MVRIRDISDPALRWRVIEVVARRRGVRPEEIPNWLEIEEAAYQRLLTELGGSGEGDEEPRGAR